MGGGILEPFQECGAVRDPTQRVDVRGVVQRTLRMRQRVVATLELDASAIGRVHDQRDAQHDVEHDRDVAFEPEVRRGKGDPGEREQRDVQVIEREQDQRDGEQPRPQTAHLRAQQLRGGGGQQRREACGVNAVGVEELGVQRRRSRGAHREDEGDEHDARHGTNSATAADRRDEGDRAEVFERGVCQRRAGQSRQQPGFLHQCREGEDRDRAGVEGEAHRPAVERLAPQRNAHEHRQDG